MLDASLKPLKLLLPSDMRACVSFDFQKMYDSVNRLHSKLKMQSEISSQPQPQLQPQSKLQPQSPPVHQRLVVLDMNGVLCYTDYDGLTYGPKSVHRLESDFKVRRKHVFVRPYIHTALSHLFANYDVAVWTSNGDSYALPIIQNCLGHYAKELKFLWTAKDCDVDSGTGVITKNLDKISGYRPSDIVLIDDTPSKKTGASESGLIVASAYSPLHKNDNEMLFIKSKVDSHFFDKQHHQHASLTG